jgi:phosphoglucosamine mutase
MEKLFGTDGVRGVAGEYPLDRSTITRIGHSLATRLAEKLGRNPRIVIGRDTRESGPWISEAFYSGAGAGGAVCESAGVITTPGVAFITDAFSFDAGIVISASHNPYLDNGIKVFSPTGKKIDEATERLIENDVFTGAEPVTRATGTLSEDQAAEFHTAYLDHLRSKFPKLDLTAKKLVIDCANGASCEFATKLFSSLGADLIVINDLPNGRNINENCGSLHLDQLQAAVREHSADLGIAFDGDADRSLFADEKGEIVDGDATLWILAQFLKESGGLVNNTVVATVMSNIGLELALNSRSIKLLRTSVGDKYVLDELLSSDSELGGEQSGHIILPNISLVGDGMMTALFVLETMFEQGASLSEAVKGFTRYPQILLNVKVKQKRPFETVQPIAEAAKEVERELDGNGRLLLRYSGTENLARVMIEGKDQGLINEKAHRLADVIRAELS